MTPEPTPEEKLQIAMHDLRIPEHMRPGLERYVMHGVRPGHFLCAMLDNDLREAVSRADETNLPLIGLYIAFFEMYLPIAAWGGSGSVDEWTHQGGLLGPPKPYNPQDWQDDAERVLFTARQIEILAQKLKTDGHLDAQKHLDDVDESLQRLQGGLTRMKRTVGTP